MGNTFTKQGLRFLYDYTMDGIKMEQLNECKINLAIIYIMLIKLIITLAILILSLKKSWMICVPGYRS